MYIYCIAPNFRGTKFSRIGLLQIFAEKNFADKGFPLVTLGSRMHYSCRFVLTTPSLAACFQIQAFLLRGKPRLEPSRVSFVGDHQLRLSSRRCLPIDKRNRNLTKAAPRNLEAFALKQRYIECHVALDVHAIVQKWNSYLFPDHTTNSQAI